MTVEDKVRKREKAYIESLESLNKTLLTGWDIRQSIVDDLRKKIREQDEVLCPWFKTGCRYHMCTAFDEDSFTCKAFNKSMAIKGKPL